MKLIPLTNDPEWNCLILDWNSDLNNLWTLLKF